MPYSPEDKKLLDYFAGCALTGFIACTDKNFVFDNDDYKKYSEDSYDFSRAMLEESRKEENQ